MQQKHYRDIEMSASKPQRASTSHLEALDSLRQAWRHIECSKRLLQQARRNPTDNVVVEGLLILALEHAEKSQAALEHAAKLLRPSRLLEN